MAVELTPEQGNALFVRLTAQLNGFDDVLVAAASGDVEAAYRIGRRMLDALRLIQEELGWEQSRAEPTILSTIPKDELAMIVARLEADAAGEIDAGRAEREASLMRWDEVTLVRDACRDLASRLASDSTAAGT